MSTQRCLAPIILSLVATASTATVALADQVIVRPQRDTTLYAEDAALSNGAGNQIFVGLTKQRRERRALIAFDIASAVPAGATITRTRLRLFMSRTNSDAIVVAVHRLQQDWGESTSIAPANGGMGAPASAGDATWTHRVWPSEPWAHEGGDFVATPSAMITVESEGTFEWASVELLQDVRDWLDDPSSAHGWILLSTTPNGTKRFGSREGASGGRPALLIDYDPPAAPSGACCAADGSCTVRLDPATDCTGMYLGAATSCDAAPCPPAVGGCCTPDAAAACAIETASVCDEHDGVWLGPVTTCEPRSLHDHRVCPVVLTPFVDPLPLPAAAQPSSGRSGGEASYEMRMVELQQKLHRDLPETTVWGYSDSNGHAGYPGPTIEASSGKPVRVRWINDLRDKSGALRTEHVLEVDTCVHGAELGPPRAVVHLHGGHVASQYDGQPDITLRPGESTVYEYPNAQTAATLWYHDHALGVTRLNVYMGLAGYYLLRDDEERALDLPKGDYEVPLALQDRSFLPDGSLYYPPMWQEHFFGDTPVINGKAYPYLEVHRGKYRFRILNGSTSRSYRLHLSNNVQFMVIGTDGGLLPRPVPVSDLAISPGERYDVVVDFEHERIGSRITLENSALAPFPKGGDGVALPQLMQFVVKAERGFTKDLPTSLRTIPKLDPDDAVISRDFTLRRRDGGSHEHCAGSAWAINDLGWSDITERPHLGTSEIWRFINRSGVTHPMHMHLVMFQVLDRQPFTLDEEDDIVVESEAEEPLRIERGWKDTVQVGPFEMVRVIARFEDFAGRFPYHCHVLEHEEHEMMRQFEAIAVCGDGALARGYEECDDGNTHDGDDCDSLCREGNGAPQDEDAGSEETEPSDAGRDGPDAGGTADAGEGAARAANERASGCGCNVARRSAKLPFSLGMLALAALAALRRRAHVRAERSVHS